MKIIMNDETQKKAYYAMLFEYYKSLLTIKQQEMFISYYDEDYSLKEIAESLSISRNAVWDTLKKVITLLEYYEDKLQLYQKNLLLNEHLAALKLCVNEKGKEIIKKIEEME